MTSKDIEADFERDPFIPLRIHLVGGKTLDIPTPGIGYPMRNALLVLQRRQPGRVRLDGYDVLAFKNIERVEQLADDDSAAA